MAKRKNSPNVYQPGSMLDQRTFQDFNKKVPSASDPNETKEKENPEALNLADQAKDPASASTKEKFSPQPATPRKRIKSNKQ